MGPRVRFRTTPAALAALAAFSVGMSGCSGAGSESLGPAAARPAPDPLGAPQNPTGTSEFNRNDGLDIINADAAYARGATGAGVTVAVIDTGIDADHPDLANNISINSYDVIAGSHVMSDATGHGTKVAGVVAAEQNGLGTHGVAYDATLLAIDAYSCSSGGCGYYYSDLANAVNYATDQLAHVINMSLSGTSGSSQNLQYAIQRAADSGAFVVIAAGNDGNAQPGYPANTASGEGFGNRVVAVGAVTDSGAIASFSNACGSVMNNCLVAPGVDIATTEDGATNANTTTLGDGTSFATPHVSGALALLIQLYPDAYSADPGTVMMFMLDGAEDLGDAGIDSVFGHGLLDVAGAIDTADTAITAAVVPTESGGTASLSATALSLGPAFGDALAGNALLDNSIAVIALSDGAHPYQAQLDNAIASAGRSFGLDALLSADRDRIVAMPIGGGLSLVMAVSGEDDLLGGRPQPWLPQSGDEATPIQVAGRLDSGTDMRLGIDVTASGLGGASQAVGGAEALFWSADETLNPLPRLAGTGAGLGIDQTIGQSTRLSLGLFDGEADEAPGLADSGTMFGRIGLSHAFNSGGVARIDLGALEESGALLGSRGGGAFATDGGASTRFLTLSGSLPVNAHFDVIGGMTMASTEMSEQPGAVLRDWDDVLSSAFAIGAVARDVFHDGDRFGLIVGQPLLVFDASATAGVAVGLAADGSAVLESERVDVTPSGREIDLQVAYDRALAPGMDISSWLMMRIEPGHDADAAPGYGVGVTVRLGF